MTPASMHDMPDLPFLLWYTPPALELILGQEGVPYQVVSGAHRGHVQRAKFVLYDSQSPESRRLFRTLGPTQTPIDISSLRDGFNFDPFRSLLSSESALHLWNWLDYRLVERVSCVDRRSIRIQLITRLRELVRRAGGLWARLAAYPDPYRSAFNLRVDLDEPNAEDYFAFACEREPLADCTTHFVSTAAYGRNPSVLQDLQGRDTQSHGHFHVISRDPSSNRDNLLRADELLRSAGFSPTGFAAPQGRWNPGLDQVLEELGYLFSSDFSVGYDDLPFTPWRDGRFSRVLQIPIHPVCEGLFLENPEVKPEDIGVYFEQVIQQRLASGEPAFVYGHPERRLARMPEILRAMARQVAQFDLVWKVTLTEFARWWQFRGSLRWRVHRDIQGRLEVLFESWDRHYPLALEIFRGDHFARVPIRGPQTVIPMTGLLYERLRLRPHAPEPRRIRRPFSLKSVIREVIDWETVTPVEELHPRDLLGMVRKRMRVLHDGRKRASVGSRR